MDGPVKTGVLTFHRCINYGSYWQARCLLDGLASFGHDAVLLDHASARVDRVEWRCALRPVPGQSGDRAAYRAKTRRFFEAFQALPMSPAFPLDAPHAMERYDTVVVGSDEVWNLSHPWYGRVPLFYGAGLNARRKIAYAASIGHHDTQGGLDGNLSRHLRGFDAISVRDDASASLVGHALGTQIEVVLDPCLAFPPGPEAGNTTGSPYLALYGHGFSPAFAEAVRAWARRRGWPVVSIGYRNEWADRHWIEAGPHEFATFMANAGAVATGFFHGCVFALRHRRPFVCEGSWYRGTKLRCLMRQVGGERHLLGPTPTMHDVATLLDAPLPSHIETRIAALRRSSRRFLRDALHVPAVA
ncbi:polysaccharide pyruvyl transferase family protein [Lysobacter arvi]|uniref:Polysaccharide pyruvyl transferase family protein n=1 Tax=Lysobacter arvi TaxID=3038776 RepID=A0ABU1CBR1_9GAMM|nr:polysaccharide pyruvyl transferase family protein [Lysobacter arvi]MDR0182629.1 polysaccharide pyruvyl transferase family protein [Lysobacter arvi]